MTPERRDLAKKAECWLTYPWAPQSILKCELLTRNVIDPCCGTGILGDALMEHGYEVWESDLYDWGLKRATVGLDWLRDDPIYDVKDNTVFMNPPFSKACEFVERAITFGARKIVCFQAWSWFESAKRRDWWTQFTPQRTYVCGDRASGYLVWLTEEAKKGMSKMPKAHGWFVWERNQPQGPVSGRVYKVMP
jgi:hypothetical protein